MDVSADATAALTGPAIVDEGELKVPFSLSENNFPNDCTDPIIFSPTAESCAGWHNFLDPVNAATLPAKLLGLIQGDVQVYEWQAFYQVAPHRSKICGHKADTKIFTNPQIKKLCLP